MQFTHLVDDAVLPNVTAAREKHNASLSGAPPGGISPQALATNEAFLSFKIDELVRAMVKEHGLLPPPPVVSTDPAWYIVTRKQGLKALARATTVGLAAPIYEADIQAKINAMPEVTAAEKLSKYDMQVEFRDAQTWRRGNPFFEQMVATMGITPAQRDSLLQLAYTFQD